MASSPFFTERIPDEEAGIKRALAARASETVVMVSQEKMNSASAFAIGDLTLASTLVVDGEPDAEMKRLLAQKQITVI